jgi:hypothetical protein
MHLGHRDPGETIDSSAGILRMHTLAKLPMIAPKRKRASGVRVGLRGV